MKKTIIFLALFVFSHSSSYAHSGKTDSRGGHYEQKTGSYHYHNSNTDSTFPFVESDFLTIPPGTIVTVASEADSNIPDVLQKEIIRLKAKVREQSELIEQLKITCIDLKKENKALRKSLAKLNFALPADYNDSNAPDTAVDISHNQEKQTTLETPNDPNSPGLPREDAADIAVKEMLDKGFVYSVNIEYGEVRIDPLIWLQWDLQTKQNTVIFFSQYFKKRGMSGRVNILSSRNDKKLASYSVWNGIQIFE